MLGASFQPACPCPLPCCLEMKSQSISRCSIKETYCTHLQNLKKNCLCLEGEGLESCSATVDMSKTFNPWECIYEDEIEAHLNAQTYHKLHSVFLAHALLWSQLFVSWLVLLLLQQWCLPALLAQNPVLIVKSVLHARREKSLNPDHFLSTQPLPLLGTGLF